MLFKANKTVQAVKDKLREKKGSLLWELMLVLCILFIFLYCCMSLLGIFVKFETLANAAKSAARNIEVTGYYGYDADTQSGEGAKSFNDLIVSLLPEGFSYVGHTITIKDPYMDRNNKINLRTIFEVEVEAIYMYQMPGFNGSIWGYGEGIEVPMSYSVTGMSEVYFRDFDDSSTTDFAEYHEEFEVELVPSGDDYLDGPNPDFDDIGNADDETEDSTSDSDSSDDETGDDETNEDEESNEDDSSDSSDGNSWLDKIFDWIIDLIGGGGGNVIIPPSPQPTTTYEVVTS